MVVMKKDIASDADIGIATILMKEHLKREGPFTILFGPEAKVEEELDLEAKRQMEIEKFKGTLPERMKAEKELKEKQERFKIEGRTCPECGEKHKVDEKGTIICPKSGFAYVMESPPGPAKKG
jgi:hypothetical protein